MPRLLANLLFLTCLASLQAIAATDAYLQGLHLVKERSYPQAASQFRAQLETFAADPVYRNRTRVWLALSLLTDDHSSSEAEGLIRLVLCDALPPETTKRFATPCPTAEPWTPTTQLDTDMVSAAIAAYASLQWRRSNYDTAILLLGLALERSLNPASQESDLAPALQRLEQMQPTTPEQAIDRAETQQALLRQQMFEKIMRNKGQIDPEQPIDPQIMESMVQSAIPAMIARKQQALIAENPNLAGAAIPGDRDSMLEMARQNAQRRFAAEKQKADCLKEKMAAHQQEITRKLASGELDPQTGVAQMRENAQAVMAECGQADKETERQTRAEKAKAARKAKKEARRARRGLNNAAAWEPQIFYGLASSTICPYLDGVDVHGIEDAQRITRESIAASLEAYRGQYLESFKMVQAPVLEAMNGFLDVKAQLPKEFDPFTGVRGRFQTALGHCPEALNLELSFSRALLVVLTRPARPLTQEERLKELIATGRRLRQNAPYANPLSHMQEATEHWVMGNFYLRAQQPEKALPELQQAFAGYRPSERYAAFPELAHMPLLQAAKTLRGMVAATLQSNSETAGLQPALQQLRGDLVQVEAQAERQLNMTPDERETQQLQDMKQNLQQIFDSPQVQKQLETVRSIMSQHGRGQDLHDPANALEGMQKRLLGGAQDEEMRKKLREMEADSEINREDLTGTALERRYALYNNQALILLQLAQVELDLQRRESAQRQLRQADAYIDEHAGWIGDRTWAYREYTLARLLAAEQKASEASQAFRKAVLGWYFTPYSMLEALGAPLESTTEILEQAAAFSIGQGATEQAFAYIELAREAGLQSEGLYGMLSPQALEAEDRSLRRQAQALQSAAARRARTENSLADYETALQIGMRAVEESERGRLDPVYSLLSQIAPLEPWLNAAALGRFVEQTLQQVKRRQARRLRQDRAAFLAKQQGLSAPASVQLDAVPPRTDSDLTIAKRIQQTLPEETLLLSIWMGREQSLITALDRERVRGGIESSLPLLRLIKTFNRSYRRQQGYRLYARLLKPYLDRPYRRILLVTNGPLQNTPLAALSTDPDRQSWLGDQYLLRSLPRAELELNSGGRRPASSRLLVLDGSAVPNEQPLENLEIDAILKNFKGKRIAPEQLTKAEVMRQLPRYSLVHFAGHSRLNSDFPDFSSLSFYDGKAYMVELEQLPLAHVRLLVLGSCESATAADESFGDPFSTLHESFLDAGVESVLATLRKVNSAAASTLLTHFYALLAEGYAKDEALQKAQQAVRESPYGKRPADWAGFILSGSEAAL